MLPFAFILLIFACVFAWCAFRGLRTGKAYIPVIMFREDEYERGQTGFGFVIFANFVGAIASAIVSSAIWLGST
ncbi:MAG TPA: hypothetical protein VI168_18680 [Croceibacterium sp.]